MASECLPVGKNIYIQTPNKYFPIETHFLTLFIHWLPRSAQILLLRFFSIRGAISRFSMLECERLLNSIRLLITKEMMHLFPEARIIHERMLALRKSIIAIKNKQ